MEARGRQSRSRHEGCTMEARGFIQMNKAELLKHVYTRGGLESHVDHLLVLRTRRPQGKGPLASACSISGMEAPQVTQRSTCGLCHSFWSLTWRR